MKWIGRRQSDNVEDRRGSTPRRIVGGGIGTLIILLLIWLLGGDPMQFLQEMPQSDQSMVSTYQPSAEEDQLAQFVGVVLGDTEDVWSKIFQNAGRTYRKPKLVLYSGAVQSACGYAGAATGPFYCPPDQKVYIDLSFYRDLQQKFAASGDFAFAYVIAHEVGHHVQNQLGILGKIEQVRRQVSEREYNRYNVALELQADFYAGVWAHYDEKMHQVLEEGDLEEAINAAGAVGDDRIQRRTQGYIVPDSFTHGTSEQRQYWFLKGFKTGDVNQGNTFAAMGL
ncbi:neutral zinc metallopeptidase [candidate division KSB1 bacterium]|nr:neutral zinc metallopeptidase [candidate division KSB1 bacterium]